MRFVVEGDLTPEFAHPRLFFTCESTDYPNPGTNAVCLRRKHPPLRYLRVRATQLPVIKLLAQCELAEIEVFSEGKYVARGAAVTASSSDEQAPWSAAALTDGFNPKTEVPADRLRDRKRKALVFCHLQSALRALRASGQEGSVSETSGFGFNSEARLVDLQRWLSERRVLEDTQRQTQAILARQRDLQLLRQRIARGLHDEIGSNLGTIAKLSQMVLETAPEDPRMRDDIRKIGAVANQSVESMRHLVWLLKQDSAGRADFLAELRITAQTLLRGIPWKFSADEHLLPNPLPFDLRRNLFLAFKEILHNAAKHAGARHVWIQLTADARNLLLIVQDDGTGFDPQTAISGGAHGYVLKTARVVQIAESIEEVQSGGSPLTPRFARKLLEHFAQLPPKAPRGESYDIKDRERDILRLIVEGLLKKEIADRLDVGIHTVDTHMRTIYRKLQVTTRAAAVAKTLQQGILD